MVNGGALPDQLLAPQGVSTDAEPSAKDVAQLIRQIQREKIKAVFVENMSNPKLLAQLARDAGVTVGPAPYVDALSAQGGPAGSYLQLMRHNVTQLAAGMAANRSILLLFAPHQTRPPCLG